MIKIDIDMPRCCGLCPCFHAENPMYCQLVKADRKKRVVAPYGHPRPEWCPLSEIKGDADIHEETIEFVLEMVGK